MIFSEIRPPSLPEGAPDTPKEERIKNVFRTSEKGYVPTLETRYPAHEKLKTMIEAALKVSEEANLRLLIDDAVERSILNLIKAAHEKSLTSFYTKLYRMIKKTAAKLYNLKSS